MPALPLFGTNTKYWPLMRLTATTGTAIAGALLHTMRARTFCCTRTPGGGVRSVAFTRIDCVAVVGARRDERDRVARDDLAVDVDSSTVRPWLQRRARSTAR